MTSCKAAVSLEQLVDYQLAEMPAQASDDLEEHLFSCEDCTRRLAALAQVQTKVPTLVREGGISFILTDAIAARLSAEQVRMREFRMAPGAQLPCGAAPEDQFVILTMEADLTGITRVDLAMRDNLGLVNVRFEDIPLCAARDVVRVAYTGQFVRDFPDAILRFSLEAETAGSERRITEYTLLHSHAGPPSPT